MKTFISVIWICGLIASGYPLVLAQQPAPLPTPPPAIPQTSVGDGGDTPALRPADALSAANIYQLGMPTAVRAIAIGREVLLDVSVSADASGGVLAEIPVPDDIQRNPSSGLIHAHLVDLDGQIRGYKDGSRMRIRGMIVDEGYNAYMIYVRGTPELLPPLTVSDIAASVKNRLSTRWDVTLSNQTIRITSKQDVQFFQAWLPGETEEHHKQRPDYFREKYEFILTFIPRLTDAQFEKLRAERHAFQQRLQADGENEVSVQENALAKHPLPGYYTTHYSIYLHEPHSDGYGPVPSDPGLDIHAVYDVLALKFHPYQQEP